MIRFPSVLWGVLPPIPLLMFIVASNYIGFGCNPDPQRGVSFKIEVIDQDYALSSARIYCATGDSISIRKTGGIVGDKDSTLWSGSIQDSLYDRWFRLVTRPEIDSLQSEYANHLVADGDQKIIIVKVNGKTKRVIVRNTYVGFVHDIIDLFNKSMPKEHFIGYRFDPK